MKLEPIFTVTWDSFDGSEIMQGVDCGHHTYRAAIDAAIAFEKERKDNYHPTPWCSACGSMTSEGCHCGPIAANE